MRERILFKICLYVKQNLVTYEIHNFTKNASTGRERRL